MRMIGSSSSSCNEKVSVPSLPTTAAPSTPSLNASRRAPGGSNNGRKPGDDNGQLEKGVGPLSSIKSFRRKKYVRQQLSPLESDPNPQLAVLPAATTGTSSRDSRATNHEHDHQQHQQQRLDDDDDEIDRLQRFHATLASEETIDQWILTYEAEREQFASFAVFTEMKLDEIQDSYVSIVGRPNAVEVAACVASLIKMPGIVGCYKSLLEKLAVGIQSAIYIPRAATGADTTTASTSMAALVRGFYDRKTYFAHVRELENRLFDNRSINDTNVLRSATVDEVVRFFVQVPFQQLRLGLGEVSSRSGGLFEQLFLFMQETHAEKMRLLVPPKSIDDDGDEAYPIHVPLATSAQICRAISHGATSFSASGKEMILCSILEFLDAESFKDVYKRFDVHGKSFFLHHLSVMESSDHLQSIVEQLPNAGEMLFRLYLVSCGTQGDAASVTKQVFFQKMLSSEMEYFFLCDLSAYLNEEQFLLLSKEYEKHALERKKRQRLRRRSSMMSNGVLAYDGESDDDNGSSEGKSRGTGSAMKSSIDNFQLMIWNYVHHHRLTSAQVLSIIATVLLPSLEATECAALIDASLEHFQVDGRWMQVLRIVDEMEAEQGTSAMIDATASESNGSANVHKTRFKLLKKLFSMLSREERECWLDKVNAKYPTEAMKKKIQLLKQDAAKSVVIAAAPQAPPRLPPPPRLDDPTAHVPQMNMELKMQWIECLLEAIATEKEYSARMAMLKQVLQPFLDGKVPLPHTAAPSTKISVVTVEKNISRLVSHPHTAEQAVKPAPPPVLEERPKQDRSTSPIPELEAVEQQPPPLSTSSISQLALPTSNPDILSAFESLVQQKTEDQVLRILQNALAVEGKSIPSSREAVEGNAAASREAGEKTLPPSLHVGLSNTTKRKLSAVIAVADPMEWQEYVKLGCVDVGCQTTFASEPPSPAALLLEQPPSPRARTTTPGAPARTSVLPNRQMVPLTLTSLLGKSAAAGTPRKRESKFQKINSAAVPRTIGGLVTSWRMNTDQLVQFAKKSLSVVLKIIADAYGEMLTAGRRKNHLSNTPMRGRELSLAQLVYQQFLHSYGLPGIADTHLLAFSCAIELYRAQHLRVEYFARYCFEEVPKMELTNYLEFLECIVCDDVNLASGGVPGGGANVRGHQQAQPTSRMRFVPRIAVPDKENWMIGVEKAQEAAHLCFRAMRKSSVLAFCDRLAVIAAMGTSSSVTIDATGNGATAVAAPPSGSTPNQSASDLAINVDHLLQLVAHEWRDEQQRRDNHLLDAFRAGDVNGDGQLTSAEFSQIVLSIDRGRDLGDILLMYSETLRRTECDHINTAVFLQVAKEYELDRVVWNEDGDLRNIVNDISDLEATWRDSRCFFLGTLEALERDLPSSHFLRVCEGAGCGCLKCILDGYTGFQKMRRDFVLSQQQQQGGGGAIPAPVRNPYAVSESLLWARYWHLMRQLYDAAAESDGILTAWEGSDYIRVDPVPAMGPRFVANRRNALPNILFPDTNRISAKMSTLHDPEVFDVATINQQFASLLEHMSYKKADPSGGETASS